MKCFRGKEDHVRGKSTWEGPEAQGADDVSATWVNGVPEREAFPQAGVGRQGCFRGWNGIPALWHFFFFNFFCF